MSGTEISWRAVRFPALLIHRAVVVSTRAARMLCRCAASAFLDAQTWVGVIGHIVSSTVMARPGGDHKGQYISNKRPSGFVILSLRLVILSGAKDLCPARDPSLRSG